MCKSEYNEEADLVKRIKDGSKRIEDFRLLGKIYFDRGDYEKHLELCKIVSQMSLTNLEKALIISGKGETLNILGKKDESIECFKQSLKLLKREKEVSVVLYNKGMNHFNLSLLYYDSEKGDEHSIKSLERLEELSRKDPCYEEYMVNSHLAELYCRKKEYDKAIGAYTKAIEKSKSNGDKVWSLSGIASVYSDKKDYELSEKAFEQALHLAKENKCSSKVYFDMGVMYFDSDHKQKAIDAFNNALSYKDYDPYLKDNKEYVAEIYWYLGTLAYEYNYDFDKATEYLNNALEIIREDHVDFCHTHIILGHCYLAKENYSKAKEHYNVALSATLINEEQKEMLNKCLKEIETKRKSSGIGSFFSRKKK